MSSLRERLDLDAAPYPDFSRAEMHTTATVVNHARVHCMVLYWCYGDMVIGNDTTM